MMCKGKFVFPVFASFLILTAFACVSEAKTIYVPDDYARIQWAVDHASAGDIIIVRDGIYYENLKVDKQLTIKSENGSDNCIVDGGGFGDVITLNADGITIEGFTVRNSGSYWPDAGVKVFSNANNITYNSITNNYYGIYLSSSCNNTIANNIICSNNLHGIDLYDSKNNSISNNNILNNSYGIFLDYSNESSISNNNILNNYLGIVLDYSNENSISNNNISNNDRGIALDNSNDNKIRKNEFIKDGIFVYSSYGNIVEDNTVNGKPLVYLEGESDEFIDNAGQVILVKCKNITVMNSELTNTDVGIELFESDNCLISNNNISNNYDGISLRYSNNNSISNNNICSNSPKYGINLWDSKNNSISNNNILNNSCGIYLTDSNDNKIRKNEFIKDGLFVRGSYGNIVEDNEVNGKPLIYLEDESDKFIDNAGQIILVRCKNITIMNAEISNTDVGIELFESDNCLILDNNISNNDCGIYLYDSNNNSISNNNICSNNYEGISLGHSKNNSISNNNFSNNEYGIDLWWRSTNNIIYLNNFIDNTENADSWSSTNIWNSTEKITYTYKGKTFTNYMGNYWDNYTGYDANGDGIGDIPYSIGSDKDNYPLMRPFEYYFVPDEPKVSVSTDKYEYRAGDLMLINITFENPTDESKRVKFLWRLDIPDYNL
ncbi:hypothetical protein DRO29_08080, partial [Candidatus Bathyarchaeota archaeon]